MTGLSNFIMFEAYALLFWYGAQLIASHEINFNQMMTAMLGLLLGAMGRSQDSQQTVSFVT